MKSILNSSLFLHVSIAIALLTAGVFAQQEFSIAEIQGNKDLSAHIDKAVRVKGIVTAVRDKGFYLQTPDAEADKDPATSEGIFVFGSRSAAEVTIGDLVQVDGKVAEFSPKGARFFFKVTQIAFPTVKNISKSNPLPQPIALGPAELGPKGLITQLERFEGMRVRLDAVVVAPTGGTNRAGIVTSNGIFFVTVQNVPRPMREPGVEVLAKIVDKLPGATPAFDMNPELLRVNSVAMNGSTTLDLPTGATLKGLTGVIDFDKGPRDYERGSYTLMMDAANRPTSENVKGFIAASRAGEREVTIGGFNIQNFFDDEKNSDEATVSKEIFQKRLNKVSLAIRNALSMPDVLGIVEVESLKVLKKIADKINADAVAAGQPDPKYTAHLGDGNAGRSQNVGYLVKSTKIKVIETKELAKDIKLETPGAKPDAKLFDRPPLMLRAEVIDPKAQTPFVFTVIVNHLKSYIDIDHPVTGDLNRNKRRLEAEWLAGFVIERQKTDPAEKMVLVGDFNAFEFPDGFNDLMGILKGKSSADVITPSRNNVPTGLVNLIEKIKPETVRYSYIHDGSAQALDHIMVSKNLFNSRIKFGYVRVDADFPLVWANDASRPERVSDHDAPIVFLPLDELPPAVKAAPSVAPQP